MAGGITLLIQYSDPWIELASAIRRYCFRIELHVNLENYCLQLIDPSIRLDRYLILKSWNYLTAISLL